MAKTNSRVVWLDSLRGLAAFIVVLAHIYEAIIKQNNLINTSSLSVSIYTIMGKIGVVAFFMVSGFVIPFSLKKKNINDFAISRFFRLYPAYWFSIILMLLVGSFPLKQILINVTMFQKFFGVADINGVYWTLQMELTFYMMCAVLKVVNKLFNIGMIKTMIILLGMLSLGGGLVRFYLNKHLPVGLFLNTQIMFFGLFLRLTFDDLEQKIISKKEFIKGSIQQIIIIFLLFLPSCYFAYGETNSTGKISFNYEFLFGYGIAIFLFFLFFKFEITNKILFFLGSISYSLYLLHGIVAEYISNHNGFKFNSLYFSLPIYFLIIILLSSFSYYIIEKKSNSLYQKLKS